MEENQPDPEQDDHEEISAGDAPPMKFPWGLVIFLVAFFGLVGGAYLYSQQPSTISLSKSEKAQAMSILERRQTIFHQRDQLDAKYNADVHRLDEAITDLNIESRQLCFDLKKAHSLPPNTNYTLDEVNARLVKQ